MGRRTWWIAVLLLPMSAWAQIKGDLKIADSTETQVIELSDGSTLYGRIVDIRDDAIVFESIIGQFTINRPSVQSVKTIQKSSLRKGKVWFENPHATRLYLGPTGHTLRAGEGYFQSTYIFFIGGAYGFTDHVSVAAGGSIFPGTAEQVFYLAPKAGGALNKKLHVAIGGTVMKIPEEGDSFGSLYGVGTYGSRDDNISLGINVGFGSGEVSKEPIVMVGIQQRMSRRTSFVSENWFVPRNGEGVLSLGIRFFNETLAADLGFWRPFKAEWEGFPFIPYVDFVVMF